MATPGIIHCDGLRGDCLLGITVEQGSPFCEKCPINMAYKNGQEPIHIKFQEDPIWAELTPDGLVWHIPLSRVKLEEKWGAYFNKEYEDG